jgi:hypothetical protein
MRKILLITIFTITAIISGNAQELIDAQMVNTVTKIEINAVASLFGVQFNAQYDVLLYRIRYTSTDFDGNLDTLSGMVGFPDNDQAYSLVVFQHGTTDGRYDVPSSGIFFNALLEAGVSSTGFIVAAPDYYGMGLNEGFHPYVHAETEAIAGINIIEPAYQLAEMLNREKRDEIFISGYSQGGHAAMAMHKYIHEKGLDIDITASAPMSGPYLLSRNMKQLILGEKEYLHPGYLAYMFHGYQTAYGNLYDSFEELYKEPYASVIESEFSDLNYSIGALHDTLNILLMNIEGIRQPKLMFQDSIIEHFINDPEFRLTKLLEDNDVFNWIPEVPMRLYYCEADEQVVYTNALTTDSLMNAGGALDVAAESAGRQYGHQQCAPHATLKAVEFFKGLLSTSTEDLVQEDAQVMIYPNPAQDYLTIKLDTRENRELSTELFNVNGTLVMQSRIANGSVDIDISHLPSGIYLLRFPGLSVQSQRIVKK